MLSMSKFYKVRSEESYRQKLHGYKNTFFSSQFLYHIKNVTNHLLFFLALEINIHRKKCIRWVHLLFKDMLTRNFIWTNTFKQSFPEDFSQLRSRPIFQHQNGHKYIFKCKRIPSVENTLVFLVLLMFVFRLFWQK